MCSFGRCGKVLLREAPSALTLSVATFSSEGSANLGLSQEVGVYVVVDVVFKTGLGLYLLLQYGE